MPYDRRRALTVLLLVVLAAAGLRVVLDRGSHSGDVPPRAAPPAPTIPAPPRQATISGNDALLAAARARRSDVEVLAGGRVIRLLADDREGSRHQRFLVRVGDTLTILVAYNLDLGSRLPVAAGDSVTLRGEYVWNDRGGLIHWLHRDPANRHEPGWVELRGRRYD